MRPRIVFFLITVLILLEQCSAVCNKFALSTVVARVRSQRNERVTLLMENFYTFDSYSEIDVVASNVTELCEGMVKNFPKLISLSLIRANLSSIQPGTFQEVPKLRSLSLSFNRLTSVLKGVFDSIKTLQVLYLNKNEISTIEANAFSQMPVLKRIYLSHNKIHQLYGNVFNESPLLSSIDVSFNEITQINRNSFDDLTSKVVEQLNINLLKNLIEDFDAKSLSNISVPISLHLEGNKIARYSQIVLESADKSEIYLSNNQITCLPDDVLDDIKIRDISVFMEENPILCECVKTVADELDVEAKGILKIKSTYNCGALDQFGF